MKASRAAGSGAKRSTVGAVWCVCLAATLIASAACAQPSVRVIERDTNAGGPSGVALDEMTPYFDDPTLADALADLDGDRGAPAVRAFASWLEDHPDDERRDLAVFVHAWALFVNHRWEDAVPALEACASAVPGRQSMATRGPRHPAWPHRRACRVHGQAGGRCHGGSCATGNGHAAAMGPPGRVPGMLADA